MKKIGRIPDGGGWRAHGRGEGPGSKRGLGYDYVHSAVDDHARLAYSEILPDEKGPTCAGFLLRAAGYFAVKGVKTRISRRTGVLHTLHGLLVAMRRFRWDPREG